MVSSTDPRVIAVTDKIGRGTRTVKAEPYESHGLDFAATFRTTAGVIASCTCGFRTMPALDADLALDLWRSHRWQELS